jgi:acetyltransferase-like isoleucine patch superfamily enzyme
MNLFRKIYDFVFRVNKIHPLSTIKNNVGTLLIKGCTVKQSSEIIVYKGCMQLSGVWIDRLVNINTSGYLKIGRGTTINMGTKIYGDVVIGEDCLIAPNVFMSSSEHLFDHFKGLKIREQEKKYLEDHDSLPSRPIVINDDVWLSANTVVLPGVSICSHVVVGANSVVTRDISQPGVYVGSPARKIRNL